MSICLIFALWEHRTPNFSVPERRMRSQILNFLWPLIFSLAILLLALPLESFTDEPSTIYSLGEILVYWLIIDLSIYWQHRAFHSVPLLKRIHGFHHSETFLDYSSAFRFHPLELLLSYGIKVSVVLLLKPSMFAIAGYEVIFSFFNIYGHSNLKGLKLLDKIFVGPHYHNTHHQKDQFGRYANFGTVLKVWDMLFGTYKRAPRLRTLESELGS